MLLGGPTPAQPPDPTPKAMTLSWRSYPLGRSHKSGFPSSPLPGASLCLHPRTQPQKWRSRHHNRTRKFPFSLQLVPAQAIFRLFLLFWGLSSRSCSWRIRAPGGIAGAAGQQWCNSITSSWESPGLFIPGSEINRVERLKRKNYVGNRPDCIS